MSDLEQKSIERINMASEMSFHHYGQPLICTYSGGKDSDVMLELFKRSGVPFEVLNSHTTVDAPQTVQHIRETFHRLEIDGIKCSIDYHEKIVDGKKTRLTMWNLIPRRLMPPTRMVRYCCSELKESGGGKNCMIATGVRWAEGTNRKDRASFEVMGHTKADAIRVSDERMLLTDNDDSRRFMEHCQIKAKTIVNPIIDWTDRDVWDFYWNECESHNELYEWGHYRVGCIGCPMARRNERLKQFSEFPTYEQAYIRSFDQMLRERMSRGKTNNGKWKWENGKDVFDWWMEDPNIKGQMNIFDFLEEE